MDTKILGKILLAHQIQQHIKRIIHHDQVGFIPALRGWISIQKSMNVVYHTNRIKDKDLMISSIRLAAAIDKIQHPSMLKTLKLEIVKKFLGLIKGVFNQSEHA